MKSVLFLGICICIVFIFSLTTLLAEENTIPKQGPDDDKALVTQHSPGKHTVSQHSAGAAADGQSAPDSFVVEKLIIGLGLAAAIALCIFKWGSSSKAKKQEK
jgi:hypothetical protein